MTEIKHELPKEANHITPDECNQMIAMYKWAAESMLSQFISLRMFKQYSSKDKTTRLVYEITSLEWLCDEKWRSTSGQGHSLTEAMQNFSNDWSKK